MIANMDGNQQPSVCGEPHWKMFIEFRRNAQLYNELLKAIANAVHRIVPNNNPTIDSAQLGAEVLGSLPSQWHAMFPREFPNFPNGSQRGVFGMALWYILSERFDWWCFIRQPDSHGHGQTHMRYWKLAPDDRLIPFNHLKSLDSLLKSFSTLSVAIVGNAKVTHDQSSVIDEHDVVFRFNELQHYDCRNTGLKFTHWVNNRDENRGENALKIAKHHKVPVLIVTQQPESKKTHVAENYYLDNGFSVMVQASPVDTPINAPERTGFTLVCLFQKFGVKCSLFGYSPDRVARRHDATAEFDALKEMDVVELFPVDANLDQNS